MNNLEVIQAFSQAAQAGDLEALARYTHPDLVVREAASLPYGGEHRGIDGFLAMFARMQAAWSELSITPLAVIGEPTGDQFALHMRVEGRSPSGEPMASEVFERWVLRDGKVAEIWPFYWDTAALAAQFGTIKA